MRKVPLRGEKGAGMVALVDDEDYDRVAKHRWRLHDGGSKGGRPLLYAKTTVNVDGRRRSLFMHKLITDWPRVDHENHNGLDNQRRNLRPATASQNNQNQRAQHGVTSDYKGVCWDPVNGKWRALIVRDGRSRSLGRFQFEEEAARAYDAAARELFGEFAWLNFPEHDAPPQRGAA